MVVRKNISLEETHLKKIEPLNRKHDGNLSAAIRDAIDIAEVALHRYGTIENALSSISSEKKEMTPMEKSIETGKSVLLCSPIFQWMLKWTRGIPLDDEILDEQIDPLQIKTISGLDRRINEISRESGWNCEVSIFCIDDINPENATVTIAGNNELYRDFLAQLVIMFLANNKGMDIDIIHPRATTIRIDLKKRDEGTYPIASRKYFGPLKEAIDEFVSKKEFWKNLIEIYKSVDYNMVSLHKDHYEKILTSSIPLDSGLFESLSKRHILNISHPDFLQMLKKTHESLMVIDRIELLNDGFNIYHSYKNEMAVEKIRDFYLSLLKANGHEYEAKYSTSLIVLKHICCGTK